MIRVSVWYHGLDERYLRLVTQLGAEAVDFGAGNAFPGVREQGYPDLDGVLAIKRALQAWGLEVNRGRCPTSCGFMAGETDDNVCIENACRAIAVFGEAGADRAAAGGATRCHTGHGCTWRSTAGAIARGPSTATGRSLSCARPRRWRHGGAFLPGLRAPRARGGGCGCQAGHPPSARPMPGRRLTALASTGSLTHSPVERWVLYCIGTRAEAGGSALVFDEINTFAVGTHFHGALPQCAWQPDDGGRLRGGVAR